VIAPLYAQIILLEARIFESQKISKKKLFLWSSSSSSSRRRRKRRI
jgi:hypothetical protein